MVFLGSFRNFLKSLIPDIVLRIWNGVSVHRIHFVRREARRVYWTRISTGMSSLQVAVLGLMGAPILFRSAQPRHRGVPSTELDGGDKCAGSAVDVAAGGPPGASCSGIRWCWK